MAFELLRVSSIRGKEAASDQVWHYGPFILVRLMRHQCHVANSVMQRLCDCIITGDGVQQYISKWITIPKCTIYGVSFILTYLTHSFNSISGCLGQMCRDMRLVVLEQQNIVIGLLSYLRVIQWSVARDIVLAVLPIVLHGPSVRDNLILVLRKALFSR